MASAGRIKMTSKVMARRKFGYPMMAEVIKPAAIAATPISVFASKVRAEKIPASKRQELVSRRRFGESFRVGLASELGDVAGCVDSSENSTGIESLSVLPGDCTAFALAAACQPSVAFISKARVASPRAHPWRAE